MTCHNRKCTGGFRYIYFLNVSIAFTIISYTCASLAVVDKGGLLFLLLQENILPPGLLFCSERYSWTTYQPLTSQVTTLLAIYFQGAHTHSFYGKWLRWPFWPHRARIIVLLLKTSLTTITLKGRWNCLLCADSMLAKSTKDCVCVVTQQPITFSPLVCLHAVLNSGERKWFWMRTQWWWQSLRQSCIEETLSVLLESNAFVFSVVPRLCFLSIFWAALAVC